MRLKGKSFFHFEFAVRGDGEFCLSTGAFRDLISQPETCLGNVSWHAQANDDDDVATPVRRSVCAWPLAALAEEGR